MVMARWRLRTAAAAGLIQVVVGLGALATSGSLPIPVVARLCHWLAALLVIYPGSAAFCVIPHRMVESLPDWSLSPAGVLSAWLCWWVALYVAARIAAHRKA